MSRSSKTAFLFGVVLTVVSSSRADEPTEATKIIDRGVKAAGGEAKLAVHEAATWTGRGKLYPPGGAIDFKGKWAMQGKDKGRVVMEVEMQGEKTTVVVVVNGDKGWRKINEMVKVLDKETLAEHKEHTAVAELALLLPFARKDKGSKVALIGETKVMDRGAVGVRVTRPGRPEVRLFSIRRTVCWPSANGPLPRTPRRFTNCS